MNLRHLEIFVVVCKHMSLTKAAEELYMTQPAVSIAIRELEEFYEVKLFDRLSRRIFLTRYGEKLLGYANTILNQIQLSISDIKEEESLVMCRIGANVTIGEGYLSKIMFHLKKEIPEIHLDVSIDNVASIEKRLMNNEFDFVITDTPNISHSLILEKLGGEPMLLVCEPGYIGEDELTIRQLSDYPLLLREKGSGCRRVVDSVFEQHECFVLTKVESMSHISLIELAKGGHGIALIPRILVKKEIESYELKEIKLVDAEFNRNYYLVYHANKYMSPLILKSIEEVKKIFIKLI